MKMNIIYDKELTIGDIEKLIYEGAKLELSEEAVMRIEKSYGFLERFEKNKVIYGINTGFGPMAQYRVDDDSLNELQYNIIRSHAAGAGEPLDDNCVKAALIARVGTLVQGYSGIHISVVRLIVEFINKGIYPLVPQHGSVGASGDLVQLAHIALALIGEGQVHYNGKWMPAREALDANGLKPITMHIREGLCITNGTSVMTGIALNNLIFARRLFEKAVKASAMINEIVGSYDDFMSPVINGTKRHEGQIEVAKEMRECVAGSNCLLDRQKELYDGDNDEKIFDHKVQPYYSLRCVPQILGPVLETLENAEKITVEELNSACDNPIVDPYTENIYHGGNFHGDYISLEMDKLKIAVTRVAMLMERQMNYLFHDRINGILPPFLNLGKLGLNYGMQACQFTATSTTAECQTLSMPNYVHSIPNNNDNQDIVSMGTNSALICRHVIENAYQVMSIHYIALAQAADCLKIADKLSPSGRTIYDEIRAIVPIFVDDTPFYEDIANVEAYLKRH